MRVCIKDYLVQSNRVGIETQSWAFFVVVLFVGEGSFIGLSSIRTKDYTGSE